MTRPPAPHDEHQPMGVGIGLFNLLLAALWGGTSVTAREAVDFVPPMAVGGIRFGLAALFMLWWCRWEGVPLGLKREQIRPAVVLGVLLFLQIGTFNLGIAWSNASHATLLVNTFIFWVAIADHFLVAQARLRWVQWLGLLVAAGSVAILFFEAPQAAPVPASGQAEHRDEATLVGDLTLAVSSVLLAIKVLYTKRAVRTVPPGTLILWHDIIGTLLFFVTSLAWENWHPDPWQPAVVFSLLYAGLVVSGFCFAGQAWLLRRHGASQVSVYSFATPIFGVASAVLIRGDELSAWLLLSGALCVAGIVMVNRGGQRAPVE